MAVVPLVVPPEAGAVTVVPLVVALEVDTVVVPVLVDEPPKSLPFRRRRPPVPFLQTRVR